MEELQLRITDILHQHLTIRKDREVLQVLVSILIHHLEETTLVDHLPLGDILMLILLLLETLTLEVILHIQTAIIHLQQVVIILHHLKLVLLLDIPLNQFLLPLKTHMLHQNHPTHLLEEQDPHLHIIMLQR